MKFKQGRLLEGTRVSFYLSHQHLVNRGSSSAAAGLPEPCQFLALQLAALQGVGRRGRGGLILQAPFDQAEPKHRRSRDGPKQQHIFCEKHFCWCCLGNSRTFPRHHSGPAYLIQADLGPRRAVRAAAVTDRSACLCNCSFGKDWVGAGFCQKDVFIGCGAEAAQLTGASELAVAC